MPTLLEEFRDIQPCDSRTLLQTLATRVIQRSVEIRSQVCLQAENIFAEFGIQDFSPCELLDDNALAKIQTEPIVGIELLLEKKGFPPYLIKYFQEGIKGLTDAELQDILNWTSPILEINIDTRTAAYIRDRSRNPILTPQQKTEVENFYTKQGVQDITETATSAITNFVANKLQCPAPAVTQVLLTKVRNLVAIINSFNQVFADFQVGLNTASALVSALNITTQSIKAVIAANDIAIIGLAATPTGASGLTANISRIASNLVLKYEDEIKALDDALCAAAKVVTYIGSTLNVVYALLTAIEAILQTCILEEEDLQIVSSLTPRSFTPGEGSTYRGFKLEIRTAIGEYTAAQRRYAVALDRNNVVVLEGTPSFSSSTDVLLNEIKFRIDNLLG